MEINNVSFSYGKNEVLRCVSVKIEKGRVTSILGPNGCGKTTLFNLMTKNLNPSDGAIYLDRKNIRLTPLKEFAKKVAIVHQYNTAPQDVTVRTLVAYGRTPYTSFYRQYSREDREIIQWAMEITDINQYGDTPISALSGGERQRVWIAMALAQKTDILLLDEPTTYLDIRYQLQVLRLIRKLNRELGITTVMILHDINQAIHYSDEIIGMEGGRIVVAGNAEKVINSDVLNEIYHVRLDVFEVERQKFVMALRDDCM